MLTIASSYGDAYIAIIIIAIAKHLALGTIATAMAIIQGSEVIFK